MLTFPAYLLSALACSSAEPAVPSDAALKFLISTSLAATSLFCLMISSRTAFSVLNLLPSTSLLVILLSKAILSFAVIVMLTCPVYLLSALECSSAEPFLISDAVIKFLISTCSDVISSFKRIIGNV